MCDEIWLGIWLLRNSAASCSADYGEGPVCDYLWETSHMWMRHVTHVNEACLTCEWVMSHSWMSHVAHVNDPCQTYEWAMSQTYMNDSCHTCEWFISHMWMTHVTHVNESCHTCGWVMSHMWMSHVANVNESCRTYEWAMSRIAGVCGLWHKHLCHTHQRHPPRAHANSIYFWNTDTKHEGIETWLRNMNRCISENWLQINLFMRYDCALGLDWIVGCICVMSQIYSRYITYINE